MRRRDLVSAAIGASALAAAIFAVGGALRWSQALLAALVGLALVPLVTSRRRLARVSPLMAILGIAAGLTAIQLIPLPAAVLEALHPTGTALRAEGAALAGVAPWQAITLDAPGSLRALASFVILLGIAVLALRLAVSERGRYQVLGIMGVLCGGVAMVVGLHELFSARALYGLYELEHVGPHLLGPLLNLNHLGGLLAMGAVVAIGLAAYRRQAAWRRVAWLASACACGGFAVATVSRGATLSLIAGALVTVGVLVAQRFVGPDQPRRRRAELLTRSLPIGIVAACVVVLVIYASASNVGRQLAQTSLDEVSAPKTKFAAWRSTLVLVEESPWVGVGRGGFETSFTRVHPAAGQITFSHAENEYLQAVVDWGIPGALLLAGAGLWLVVTAIRRWRDGPLAAAALGGLVVIAVQSNVDFGIELLGIAAPLTALAATLTYVPLREAESRELSRARVLRVSHLLALAASAAVLLSSVTTSVDEDHARLTRGEARTPGEHPERIDDALTRHPLDYYPYAVAAEVAMRRGDPAAVQLLNHALRLSPSHGGLHQLAARMLHRAGHLDQAAIEYAAALRANNAAPKLVAEVVEKLPAPLAAAAIPLDGVRLETVLATLTEQDRPAVATAYLERVLGRQPNHPRACELLYARIVRQVDAAEVELAARRCGDAPLPPVTMLTVAGALARADRHADVLRLLEDVEDWTGVAEHKQRGWLARCDAHVALQAWVDATRCLRRLEATSLVPPEHRALIASRLAKIERARAEAAAASPPATAPSTTASPRTAPPAAPSSAATPPTRP